MVSPAPCSTEKHFQTEIQRSSRLFRVTPTARSSCVSNPLNRRKHEPSCRSHRCDRFACFFDVLNYCPCSTHLPCTQSFRLYQCRATPLLKRPSKRWSSSKGRLEIG